MEITRDIREGLATLVLAGRFDATWSEGVADALDECIRAGAHVVHLDLAGVVFLSSAGIRVLLGSYRELAQIGGTLTVIRASDPVHTVLKMSGLTMLLQLAESAGGPASSDAAPDFEFTHAGARIGRWNLDAAARMRVRAIGDASSILEGRATLLEPARLAFPPAAFGVGVAAFGRDASDCAGRYGEFLAVGGAAICHANVDTTLPDWVVTEGLMVPEAEMLTGIVGEGSYALELRFEATESPTGILRMSDIASLALDATAGAPAVVVMVAETAQLVGCALRTTPPARGDNVSIFGFPGIRDRLLFTAEPSWTNALALVVGVVANTAPPALAGGLRPFVRDQSMTGHLHAAAFPYRPLRKGRVSLDAALSHLFEDQSVGALLHLMNDWREPAGAGESAFTRGVVWAAPLEIA